MLLDIKLLHTTVPVSKSIDFLIENLKNQISFYSMLKLIVKILISTRIANSVRRNQFDSYNSRLKSLSWVKYASDGNRIQLHDNLNARIAKLPIRHYPDQFDLEIEARRRVGSLTPALISVCDEDGLIIESKLQLKLHQNLEKGSDTILKLLRKKLGPSKKIEIDIYIGAYPNTRFNSNVIRIAKLNKFENLPISLCHGDFWAGNIFQVPNNDIVIVDWEYCGYRIETFDGWFFVFSKWTSEQLTFDNKFFAKLSEKFFDMYDLEVGLKHIKILHMLHLFERYASQMSYGKLINSPEMQTLAKELEFIIKELTR